MKSDMNTNTPLQPFTNRLQDDAREAVQTATETAIGAANHASQTARQALHTVSDTAKDTIQNVRTKADETYRTVRAKASETAVATNQYVRQHPMPSVLGAVAIGVGLGCLLALSARRRQPTFREHFAEDPVDAAREAFYAVLAPVAHRLRGSYENARDSAEHALDKVHHFNGARVADSVTDQLRRVGGSLRFW